MEATLLPLSEENEHYQRHPAADATGHPLSVLTMLFCAALTFGILQPEEAALRAQDWPMWGYDSAQSRATPMPLPDDLHLNWVRHLPAPRRAWPEQKDDIGKLDFDVSYSPVVMGDLVFVPSMRSDRVTAYRVDDGAEVWRRYVDGPVRLAPAAWQGRVYFVSDDGHLHCVDAETGEPRWSFKAAPNNRLVLGNNRVISMWAARGGPVVKDGTVYFAAGVWPFMGTFIFALDAQTGDVVWQNTGESTNWQSQPHGGAAAFAGISPQGYLAATEDRLVVSGGRGTPALLDRHTGEIVHLNVSAKPSGGYRIWADDLNFYNHGRSYSLEDGSPAEVPEPTNDALFDRARELADELDGKPFAALAARGRLFVTTVQGDLYCFGPEAPDRVLIHDDRADGAAALSRARTAVAGEPADEREAAILQQAGAGGDGYALFLGIGDGTLLQKVALRSRLHVVGVDPDREKIDLFRRRFDDAGLYGTRISLLVGRGADMKYPPYISSLIVVDDLAATGLGRQDVHDLLKPYGGKAFIGTATVVTRDGPLPGAGQWTHQYADAARTGVSADDRVRLPLGVLWYGSVSNEHVLPRHAVGPRPQVAGGRLVILGVECISARDIYTGRELWVREFAGIGHPFTDLELEYRWSRGSGVYMTNIPGASYIGSPYVTLPDSIYMRHRGRILRLDPATGETLAEFAVYPEGTDIASNDWGPVSVYKNLLIATAEPHIFDDTKLGWMESWNATSSNKVLVMDRITGQILWSRTADLGFRHNAIVAGSGRITVIDGLSDEALKFVDRANVAPEQKSRVIAMDAEDGEVLWEVSSNVFGTYLAYSEERDILLESGSADTRSPLPDEPHSRVVARRGTTGELLWSGELAFPALIHGDRLIPRYPGTILDLLTGKPAVATYMPLLGEARDSYWKSYGCGAPNASTHLLLFRSGAAGFSDLAGHSGTGNFGGFKSGCTASMLAADGVLSAPDYTRTCTCSYQNQASLGLIHMPDADVWTALSVEPDLETVERIGINLGAPGGRRADNGTFWVPYPDTEAPSPEVDVLINTTEFDDVPVKVVHVSASAGSLPGRSVDGDPATNWQIRASRERHFGERIQYDLNVPIDLDSVDVDWAGPLETEFSIQASPDGDEWTTVLEETGMGHEGEMWTYRFEPVRAQHVRLAFGGHGDTTLDEKERQAIFTTRVARVRIGGLEFPDAYAHFMPRDVYRKHSLFVDGTDGLNWVAASGVRGIRHLELPDVNGGVNPYTVTLHFAEPDDVSPGQRVFDIFLQGNRVAENFDVAREAGGRDRAITRTFKGVRVGPSLHLALERKPGSQHPPVLSGVELVRE